MFSRFECIGNLFVLEKYCSAADMESVVGTILVSGLQLQTFVVCK